MYWHFVRALLYSVIELTQSSWDPESRIDMRFYSYKGGAPSSTSSRYFSDGEVDDSSILSPIMPIAFFFSFHLYINFLVLSECNFHPKELFLCASVDCDITKIPFDDVGHIFYHLRFNKNFFAIYIKYYSSLLSIDYYFFCALNISIYLEAMFFCVT